MNYNDFFESALSAAYKKAPMTDDDTFMRIVKERAKNMKKNDNVKQMYFTEITPEYTEPKKSHKALNVFAGVAGTAAVLTGAVFGLNWLSEHGGLKGPDVQGGAGYHENVAITEETALSETEAVIEDTEADITVEASADSETKNCIEIDAVGKPVNGVVPMDETIELDDMTVHFTGYEFDSQYMRIEYEVKYTGGEQRHTTGAPVRPIEIADTLVGDGMVIVVSHPAYEYATGIDDTVYCYADVVINGTPDYVRIPFGYSKLHEVPPAERYTEDDELFAITVHYDPDSVIRTFRNDRVKIGETGKEFKLSDAFITPTHISARMRFDEKPTQELTDSITVGLRLKDGSSIDLTNKKTIGYTKDGELYWLVAWYDEPIALDDITDANINGFCFSESGEEYYEMMRTKHSDIDGFEPVTVAPEENRNYLTDAHVDTDECSIDMNWLTFDGITLRLQYDVTFRNGLPADGSIPVIVACGDNEILYTTHGTRVDKLGVDGNKVSYIGEVVYNRIMSGEPIKLRFRHFTRAGEEEMISWLDQDAGVAVMTPDELPDAIIVEYEVNKDIAMKWGSKATVEKATLCRDSVMFTLKYSNLYKQGFNLHDTYLAMNDGSKVDLEGIEDQGGTASSDTAEIWQHYELSEPIDPSAVAQIYVCGECVYGDTEPIPTMQQDELPEETIAGDTEAETAE